MKQKIRLLFIALWIFVCLFKFDIFSDKPTQLYISFTLATLAISGVIFFRTILNKSISRHLPLFLVGCIVWMLYIFANSLFRSETDGYFIVYITASLLFLIALTLYFKEGNSLADIYKYFAWLGILESGFIFLQYFQILDTGSIYSVTGTFHNPNITAMYMAICMPFFFGQIIENPKKWVNYILSGCLVAAVVLTGCRTAYIGVFIVAGVYTFSVPGIKDYVKRLKPKFKYLILVLVFIPFVLASVYFYQSKKESADGRLFIWKMSMSMVEEKPITGYGYGFFDKNYNLKQADYFAENTATKEEMQNARYVYMPYNDYLENLVYGGLTGLIFYLLFLIVPTLYAAKLPDKTAFSILLSVAVMSLTNFTFQSVPVWLTVLIIIAYVVSQTNRKRINIKPIRFVYIILFIGTALTFYVSLRHTYGKIMLATALESMKSRNPEKAYSAFEKGTSYIGKDGEFYILYGKFLLREKKTEEAENQLLTAKKYSSNPEIFIDLGYCNYRFNNINEAERNLLLGKYMVPSHFKARYSLLQLYNRTNQAEKAITLSEEILILPFNKNNKDALKARNLASQTLKHNPIPQK